MAGPAPSRRVFLAGGVASLVLLTVAGTGLWLQPSVLREPRRPLKVLTQRQFSALAAAADRFVPPREGWPTPWELEVPEAIDELFTMIHPADAADLGSVLDLMENGLVGLLVDFRTGPFTARSPEGQDATLLAWRHSAIGLKRAAYKALAGLCLATYYGHERVFPLIGYGGPPDFTAYMEAKLAAQEALLHPVDTLSVGGGTP